MARGGTIAAITLLSCHCAVAQAQTKLTAHYTLSIAGIAIGEGDWTVEVGKDRYTARSSGRLFGVWRVMLDRDIAATTRGAAAPGRLTPTGYSANFSSDSRVNDVRVIFRNGTVSELETKPPVPIGSDHVPVTASTLRGALDPLTAGLTAMPTAADLVSPAVCQRTLPIFDGSHRFDMALSFKRMETVMADRGYGGPAVVCAMTYRPVAGYNAETFRADYLRRSRDMEMWFAPVPGTRLLAVFCIRIPTVLGTAELRATEFDGRSR